MVTPGSVLECLGPPCGLLNDLWDTWDPPRAIPKTLCTPLDHHQNTWNSLLNHPQNAWDPLGTP